MISSGFPDSDEILADLGGPFVHAYIEAVDGARTDYAAFREWRPGWFPSFTERFIASLLHERIWDRLVRAVEGMDGIYINDREPRRELHSGTKYRIRIKRHHPGDRISSYPTAAANAFWSNHALTLEGLESYGLALGYYWDRDLRAVGDAMLSFRDGKNKPIWAIQLRGDAGNAAGFTWSPVAPNLPEIDLSGVLPEAGEESST